MPSDNEITKVRGGMRVISTDGITIGKVWRVHLRDTEAVIEIRPQSFLRALLDAFVLPQRQPDTDHLFLAAHSISQVVGKRVYVQLAAAAARTCISRPPWIERDRNGLDGNRLD